MAYIGNIPNILMLAFGFGFVIFWHELGHFLAAKWADVKVEQFAVGFGQAVICWRKGLGFTWGTSQQAYLNRVKSHIEHKQLTDLPTKELAAPTEAQLSAAAAEIGISETEYRLNWIPLGGYVKMMGQDDLKPGQTFSDPRSYNNKTIAQRMVIVSAGVIMNIILAAIGFMYIFTVGFNVPKAKVGMVVPGSPAQSAYRATGSEHVVVPLQVGDEILSLNGREMTDFDKVKLNTLLLSAGEKVPMKVRHSDHTEEELWVTPGKATPDSKFPQIGLAENRLLEAPPKYNKPVVDDGSKNLAEYLAIKPGDKVMEADGKPVADYTALDRALQESAGKDLPITVMRDGKPKQELLKPHFMVHFGEDALNFAGMEMPVKIESIQSDSPLIGKLFPNDVIARITEPGPSGGQYDYPDSSKTVEEFNSAGEHGIELQITVDRDGQRLDFITAKPTVSLSNGKKGFGIGLLADESDPIIAGVLPDSPAKAAGVRPASRLVSINGLPVHNWFDVNNIMKQLKADQPVELTASFDGVTRPYTLKSMSQSQIDELKQNRLQAFATLNLVPDTYDRKAPNHNVFIAAEMGVGETRDAVLQVYQTVRSMATGNISAKEVSGPVGILGVGYLVAKQGTTHLIWFLSIISANLAVMNFLPIPIVDGGLFTFLIIEKLKGSPISQRTQSIAQAVGLVLLLSVFVFATYQDVARLPMMFR